MNITVQHLIKFLPVDKDMRQNVLATFDSLTDDQKLALRKVCWSAYFDLLKANINYEFENSMEEVRKGTRNLSKNLYQEIEQKVSEDFKQKLMKEEELSNMKGARDVIQKHLSQMNTTSSITQGSPSSAH